MRGEQPAKLATGGRQGLAGQTIKLSATCCLAGMRCQWGLRERWAGLVQLSGVTTTSPGGGKGPLEESLGGLTLGSDG